jgi:hypothetical protein
MYEANITVQAIISYKWLADQNFMVHPRRHGLYFQDENIQVFIPGIEKEEKEFTTRLDKVVAMKLEAVPVGFPVPHPLRSSGEDGTPTVVTGDLPRDPTPVHRSDEEDLGLAVAPYALGEPPGLPIASHCHDHKDQEKARKKKKKKNKTRFNQSDQSSSASEPISSGMASVEPDTHQSPKPIPRPRLLDLFSGTGSTAEAFKEQGFEVITLDFNAKYRPDILVDILDWDYKKAISPGYFHTIFTPFPPSQSTVRQ